MFRTRNNYPTSPSQHIEYGTPKLTVIDGEGRTFTKSATSSASSKFYSENHPLSKTGRPTPYKKLNGHPVRSGGSMSHRRTPRQQQLPQQQRSRRNLNQSPVSRSAVSGRAAWNSTNNDLSIYSLTEEERLRRKKILRTPVDTGRRKPHRMKSVAASPGGAKGPKKYVTPAASRTPPKSKRAWLPSGKTTGKGLVERTPGFVDDTWMKFTNSDQQKQDEDHDTGVIDEVASECGSNDEVEEEYDEIDRVADPFRTTSVRASASTKKASSVSSFRKPVGTRLSLHTASKAWDKRKKAHPDVFTAQDAELMSALRAADTTSTPEQSKKLQQKQCQFTPSVSTTKNIQPPPRPMKASTELGRRQRAEQEGAFMELEAQLTRLRAVKGIEQEQTFNGEENDGITKHWIGFHANLPSTNAVLNNTPNPTTYNTRTMLTSLAHVASTLASSLAENEIRLQEESKARIKMQDLLLETQSELKHMKAQQSEDSDAIARMITQMPDVALTYLTSSPSASPSSSPSLAPPSLAPPPLSFDVNQTIQEAPPATPIVSLTPSTPSEYSSLLQNHETTMKENDMTPEKIEEERFAMTSQDVVAVASLPDMNTSIDIEEQEDQFGEEDQEDQFEKNLVEQLATTVIQTGYNHRTTTQMGFTITEFLNEPVSAKNVAGTEDDEMARKNIPSPAPRTTVPTPTISSGPGYKNVVLDSPLDEPIGKIDYSSYMKRPSMPKSATVEGERTATPAAAISPVRKKTNSAAAWLSRKK
jgi:hypothetical protein